MMRHMTTSSKVNLIITVHVADIDASSIIKVNNLTVKILNRYTDLVLRYTGNCSRLCSCQYT